MTTALATRSWLPHKAFDPRSALEHAADGEMCAGTLQLHDPDAPVVLAACDTCTFQVGLRQCDLAPEGPSERPDRWWDR